MSFFLLEGEKRRELKDIGVTVELFELVCRLVKSYKHQYYVILLLSWGDSTRHSSVWYESSLVTIEQLKANISYGFCKTFIPTDIEGLDYVERKISDTVYA